MSERGLHQGIGETRKKKRIWEAEASSANQRGTNVPANFRGYRRDAQGIKHMKTSKLRSR